MSRPGWRDIHLVPAKVELIFFLKCVLEPRLWFGCSRLIREGAEAVGERSKTHEYVLPLILVHCRR